MITAENDYQTTDLALAAFLMTMGHPLRDVQLDSHKKAHYYFGQVPAGLEISYYSGAPIPLVPRDYADKIRTLKGLLRAKLQ